MCSIDRLIPPDASFHQTIPTKHTRRSLLGLLLRRSSNVEHGQHNWPDGLVVKDGSSHKLRMVQPNQKGNLEVIVEGNKSRNKADSLFNDGKGGKDDPVG